MFYSKHVTYLVSKIVNEALQWGWRCDMKDLMLWIIRLWADCVSVSDYWVIKVDVRYQLVTPQLSITLTTSHQQPPQSDTTHSNTPAMSISQSVNRSTSTLSGVQYLCRHLADTHTAWFRVAQYLRLTLTSFCRQLKTFLFSTAYASSARSWLLFYC